MEEMVEVLLCSESFEFKRLFDAVSAAMKSKKLSSGGEEMMRLRTYDKLQSLVREGDVIKTGKSYKGVRKQLLLVAKKLKELRLPRQNSTGNQPAGAKMEKRRNRERNSH